MYESDDIVKYLFGNYGDGQVPWGLSLGIFTALSCGLALLPRHALLLQVTSTPTAFITSVGLKIIPQSCISVRPHHG